MRRGRGWLLWRVSLLPSLAVAGLAVPALAQEVRARQNIDYRLISPAAG